MDKNVFCEELVKLEKQYPGVLDHMAEYNTRLLSALAAAHSAYTDHVLSKSEHAKIAALNTAISGLKVLPDMETAITGLQKQINVIQGDYADKAWRAYRAHMSANGSSGKSTTPTRDAFEGVVVRCAFGGGKSYHVAARNAEQYNVWKNTAIPDVREIVTLPDFLEGFVLTSLTSHRKLTWGIVNKKTPTMCKDGIGTRVKGKEGGSLAEIVSHDPAAWETEQRKINSAKAPKTTAKKAN